MSTTTQATPRHELSACLARDPALVAETARYFEDFVLESDLPDSEGFQLRLVLSEALNNLVEHVQPNGDAGGIEIRCEIDADSLYLEIRDSGPAIERLPSGELPDSLSERGRGWAIIRHWADEVSYRTEQNRNFLVMRKTLAEAGN